MWMVITNFIYAQEVHCDWTYSKNIFLRLKKSGPFLHKDIHSYWLILEKIVSCAKFCLVVFYHILEIFEIPIQTFAIHEPCKLQYSQLSSINEYKYSPGINFFSELKNIFSHTAGAYQVCFQLITFTLTQWDIWTVALKQLALTDCWLGQSDLAGSSWAKNKRVGVRRCA